MRLIACMYVTWEQLIIVPDKVNENLPTNFNTTPAYKSALFTKIKKSNKNILTSNYHYHKSWECGVTYKYSDCRVGKLYRGNDVANKLHISHVKIHTLFLIPVAHEINCKTMKVNVCLIEGWVQQCISGIITLMQYVNAIQCRSHEAWKHLLYVLLFYLR